MTNCTVYCCTLMTVMIVGGEVFANIGPLLLYIFVLCSFYCIFKIVCPCTAWYLF